MASNNRPSNIPAIVFRGGRQPVISNNTRLNSQNVPAQRAVAVRNPNQRAK